ncbi:MAG: hypothetical protein FVQ82_17650 [Planctomycetes bacterium]|nr:hypothetical protein [Planctomycetota bacterium]
MAEVYPSDSDLLDLLSEAETGVEYIPTGTAPYYLHFRKLLYRLLLATRRANDLRLYDEGGLTFGVKPGKFWAGKTLVEYDGSSGNVFADDKSNIFVYIDNAGVLQFTDYTMFPDQFSPHVRLAEITTADGDITSFVDCRDQHSLAMPTVTTRVVEAHTENDQLSHSESGSVHTNLGASGAVTIFMPSFVAPGTEYTISVQAAQQLNIDPVAGAIIDDSGVTASKYKYCSTVGAFMSVVSDGNGDWIVTGKSGTWVEEA